MQELKVETIFDLEDFKTMEKIEKYYFPDENITPATEVFKWYKKNPWTCIGIRNKQGEVIGNVNILPLKEKVFYAIYEDKMNEADVMDSQIEIYEEEKSYFLYLSSISIDKRYRNHYQVIMNLLKGCIHVFDVLLEKKVKIEKIMADTSTIHGEKIAKKLLKMDYVRDTNHDSKIYCKDGDEFINTISQIKQLLEVNR